MKSILKIIPFIFLSIACDVIDGDVLENPESGGPIDTTTNDSVLNFAKKVLIEEYTGHKCGNCPGGARLIVELKEQTPYKGKLIPISVHAGGLANWAPPGAPKYTTNFTTSVGDDMDGQFGVSLTGVPRGLINRKEYNGSKLILPGTFEESIQDILSEPNTFIAFSGAVSINEASRTISATINTHFNEDVDEDLNLSVFVTEDSIIDWQKNYSVGGDPNYIVGDIADYVHMHVLRGSMNGTWGELINESNGATIVSGSKISKAYQFTLAEGSDIKKCNVVAFAYKIQNDEVLQAREWHIRDL